MHPTKPTKGSFQPTMWRVGARAVASVGVPSAPRWQERTNQRANQPSKAMRSESRKFRGNQSGNQSWQPVDTPLDTIAVFCEAQTAAPCSIESLRGFAALRARTYWTFVCAAMQRA